MYGKYKYSFFPEEKSVWKVQVHFFPRRKKCMEMKNGKLWEKLHYVYYALAELLGVQGDAYRSLNNTHQRTVP